MELTDFDARLADSDLVLSGEGRIDAQTAFGKTCLGVARKAAAAGVGCVCFGGSVTTEGEAALLAVGAVSFPVIEGPTTSRPRCQPAPRPWNAPRNASPGCGRWPLARPERGPTRGHGMRATISEVR